ncbi:MAG: sigma-54-dependent Fis family transcriptional regulator [Deltaproteobacteria bacterium]|nr:MAG: sigma-54-dependent Fis family transcriptional regulator [Deltaproteobacteria bacterium]
MSSMPDHATKAIERERDLLLSILELSRHDAVASFLDEALALIVEVSGARIGYIELRAGRSRDGEPEWSRAHGADGEAVNAIRRSLSTGIIADALAQEKTVETASASSDQRFAMLASVRRLSIQAVLCVPIGRGPAFGVLYLQGAPNGGPFPQEVRRHAELFAHHVAPAAGRLLQEEASRLIDPTLPWRAKLGGAAEVVGRSGAIAEVLKTASLVAPLDLPLLITGPTGSGKTRLAKLIASQGPRGQRPFVAVNCANLPENLVESELFGALPGAHSTATRKIPGKVVAAEGGTLFLDEISELTPAAQAKLLYLVQTGEYMPLGGTQSVRANVRIIAATHADLTAGLQSGRFREDLYYRLRVMPIDIPGLDQRREDIAPLAAFFCGHAAARHGMVQMTLTAAAVRALEFASWPGHVRELENAVEAAVIRAYGDGATNVTAHHVFPNRDHGEKKLGFYDSTRAFQRQLLADALRTHGWNVPAAAEALGVARSHAYAMVRDMNLRRPDPEG